MWFLHLKIILLSKIISSHLLTLKISIFFFGSNASISEIAPPNEKSMIYKMWNDHVGRRKESRALGEFIKSSSNRWTFAHCIDHPKRNKSYTKKCVFLHTNFLLVHSYRKKHWPKINKLKHKSDGDESWRAVELINFYDFASFERAIDLLCVR